MGGRVEVSCGSEGEGDEVEESGDRMDDEERGEGMSGAGRKLKVSIVGRAKHSICSNQYQLVAGVVSPYV